MAVSCVGIAENRLVVICEIRESTQCLTPDNGLVKQELGRRPKQPKAVKRRKNSENPPEVKQTQRNSAELLLLLEKEPRDQKAAEHEKHQHAVATRDCLKPTVVEDD